MMMMWRTSEWVRRPYICGEQKQTTGWISRSLYCARDTLLAFQRSDGMMLSLPRNESSKGNQT
jgi:hypothetical protein